jgi:hypothetical protein
MTARTKLTVLERVHTLLIIVAGVTAGWFVMGAIPGSGRYAITGRDVMQLSLTLLAAYAAAFLADQLVNLAFLPLRRRLRAAVGQTGPQA